MTRRIVFFNPDYHNAFLLAKELEKHDTLTTIVIQENVPSNLIFDTSQVRIWRSIRGKNLQKKIFTILDRLYLVMTILTKSDVIVFYGKLPELLPIKKSLVHFRNRNKRASFDFFFQMCKLRRIGVVYLPSGCLDEFLKSDFSEIEKGNICENCGFWDRCDDKQNYHNFERVRRYSNLNIGNGAYSSNQFVQKHVPYRSLDLNIWNPSIRVPGNLKISKDNNILVVHSFYNSGRNFMNRNIKGTPHVVAAVDRLKREGYSIQLELIHDVPISEMRFIQVQADIIVDELIYGWHGSTSIESMALGKPTICYLRPEWHRNFQESFPDLPEIPIVSATTSTVYDKLKMLCDDSILRDCIGKESRKFAEKFFDVELNAQKIRVEFENLLENSF